VNSRDLGIQSVYLLFTFQAVEPPLKKKKNKRKRSQKREAPGTYFLLWRNTKGHIEFMNVGLELPVYVKPTRLVKAMPEFCRPPTPWPTADMAKIMVSVK
jgi:hypothetical protein